MSNNQKPNQASQPAEPRRVFVQNPHLDYCSWTKVSAYEPEVNPAIIDEFEAIEISAYQALQEKLDVAIEALKKLSQSGEGTHFSNKQSVYESLPALQVEFSERLEFAAKAIRKIEGHE